MKQKALAYILRYVNEPEILVFDHVKFPEVSPQVVGGSIEAGEDPLEAVKREVLEESGLDIGHFHYKLGEYQFEDKLRHVFVVYLRNSKESWDHLVSEGEEDKGHLYRFYWMPLSKAKVKLVGAMGDYLQDLRPYIKRKACRAIFLTPEHETLLMKVGNETSKWRGWITPGGGIEDGESEEEALRRELKEELGVTDFKITKQVWERTHTFAWNEQVLEQYEKFYLIESEKFEAGSTMDLSESELLAFEGFKWWSVSDINNTTEVFAPRKLGEYLTQIIDGGLPTNPIDVGL